MPRPNPTPPLACRPAPVIGRLVGWLVCVALPFLPADVKDIKLVINYDMPNCAEDYVHRIGRTGRAGASGTAYSFFTSSNGRMAKQLVSILEEAQQPVPPELRQFAMTSGGPQSFRSRGGSGRGGGRGGGGFGGGSDYTGSNALPIGARGGGFGGRY